MNTAHIMTTEEKNNSGSGARQGASQGAGLSAVPTLIVGLGKTGLSCVRFLTSQGVPVAVTDLATVSVIVYSLPLDVSSLQNLIQNFARIQEQVESECGDESTEYTKPNTASGQSQAGMANTGDSTAGNGLSDRCSCLPQPDRGQNPEGIR